MFSNAIQLQVFHGDGTVGVGPPRIRDLFSDFFQNSQMFFLSIGPTHPHGKNCSSGRKYFFLVLPSPALGQSALLWPSSPHLKQPDFFSFLFGHSLAKWP